MTVQFEYNRFFPTVNGDKGEHVKAICDTFDELKVAMRQIGTLFQIDPEDVPFEEPPRPQAPRQVTQRTQNVVCGVCGGPVYDNRAKKASGEYTERRADFSCKKKSCDAAMWLTRDGEHGEWKQFSRAS